MSAKITRRSFLGGTATAMAAVPALTSRVHSAEVIPGFDQTHTDFDRTKAWSRFSERKIRVGLVGYGVCQFSAQFEFQHHPNVEVVAVVAERVKARLRPPAVTEVEIAPVDLRIYDQLLEYGEVLVP